MPTWEEKRETNRGAYKRERREGRGRGGGADPGDSGFRGEATLSRGDDGTEAKLAVTRWRRGSMSHWGLEKSYELPEHPSTKQIWL